MNVAVVIEMVWVPLSVLLAPEKVCVPELAVKVPSTCKFPTKEKAAAPVSFQSPPLLIVTLLVKVLVPVLASVRVPVTDVVPVTPRVQVAVVPVAKTVPVPTVRFPAMAKAAPVVA